MEVTTVWDRAVTDAELEQFWGREITDTAREIGEEKVIEDEDLLANFFQNLTHDREPCAYFGPISTLALCQQILLNKNANTEQLAAAARELRVRYLANFSELVERAALRAME
jgi:hypothetical protein